MPKSLSVLCICIDDKRVTELETILPPGSTTIRFSDYKDLKVRLRRMKGAIDLACIDKDDTADEDDMIDNCIALARWLSLNAPLCRVSLSFRLYTVRSHFSLRGLKIHLNDQCAVEDIAQQ